MKECGNAVKPLSYRMPSHGPWSRGYRGPFALQPYLSKLSSSSPLPSLSLATAAESDDEERVC